MFKRRKRNNFLRNSLLVAGGLGVAGAGAALALSSKKLKNIPVTAPKNIPVTKPKNIPVTAPKNIPVTKPKNIPVTKPKNIPVNKPKNIPVTKPKNIPVTKPKNIPVNKPKNIPVDSTTVSQINKVKELGSQAKEVTEAKQVRSQAKEVTEAKNKNLEITTPPSKFEKLLEENNKIKNEIENSPPLEERFPSPKNRSSLEYKLKNRKTQRIRVEVDEQGNPLRKNGKVVVSRVNTSSPFEELTDTQKINAERVQKRLSILNEQLSKKDSNPIDTKAPDYDRNIYDQYIPFDTNSSPLGTLLKGDKWAARNTVNEEVLKLGNAGGGSSTSVISTGKYTSRVNTPEGGTISKNVPFTWRTSFPKTNTPINPENYKKSKKYKTRTSSLVKNREGGLKRDKIDGTLIYMNKYEPIALLGEFKKRKKKNIPSELSISDQKENLKLKNQILQQKINNDKLNKGVSRSSIFRNYVNPVANSLREIRGLGKTGKDLIEVNRMLRGLPMKPTNPVKDQLMNVRLATGSSRDIQKLVQPGYVTDKTGRKLASKAKRLESMIAVDKLQRKAAGLKAEDLLRD
jgi:hypothetical protein